MSYLKYSKKKKTLWLFMSIKELFFLEFTVTVLTMKTHYFYKSPSIFSFTNLTLYYVLAMFHFFFFPQGISGESNLTSPFTTSKNNKHTPHHLSVLHKNLCKVSFIKSRDSIFMHDHFQILGFIMQISLK